jgi:hypothetical protein
MQRDFEGQRAVNSEQLAQRAKMGDHLDVAREIEHFAIFTGRKEADAARAQLDAMGYRCKVVRRGWSKFELHAKHTTGLETHEVDVFVGTVFAVVERNHGTYDGWDGPLEASPGHRNEES